MTEKEEEKEKERQKYVGTLHLHWFEHICYCCCKKKKKIGTLCWKERASDDAIIPIRWLFSWGKKVELWCIVRMFVLFILKKMHILIQKVWFIIAAYFYQTSLYIKASNTLAFYINSKIIKSLARFLILNNVFEIKAAHNEESK